MNRRTIDGEGIHSVFEPRAGDEALLERRLTFLNETTFEDAGTDGGAGCSSTPPVG